jgi:hypothetical protein
VRYVVETGTDGASVCFFDPAALPGDFDDAIEKDPVQIHSELQREERFWFQETGGDGRQLFHVCFNESFNRPKGAQVTQIAQFKKLACPSGELWICGAEYAAKDPERGSGSTPVGGLGKYVHMGGKISLPAGHYAVNVYECKYRAGTIKKAVAANVPAHIFRRKRLVETIGVAFFFLAAAIALICAAGLVLGLVVEGLRSLAILEQTGPSRARFIFRNVGSVFIGSVIIAALFYVWNSRWSESPQIKEIEDQFPRYVIEINDIALAELPN